MRFRFDGKDPLWPPTPSSRISARQPRTESEMMDRRQCVEYLRLVHDGLGRTMACAQLGIDLGALNQTLAQRPSFRRALEQVEQVLADNLFSILYAAALKGDTRAALFLLSRHDRTRERLATRRENRPEA